MLWNLDSTLVHQKLRSWKLTNFKSTNLQISLVGTRIDSSRLNHGKLVDLNVPGTAKISRLIMYWSDCFHWKIITAFKSTWLKSTNYGGVSRNTIFAFAFGKGLVLPILLLLLKTFFCFDEFRISTTTMWPLCGNPNVFCFLHSYFIGFLAIKTFIYFRPSVLNFRLQVLTFEQFYLTFDLKY